MVWVGGWVRVAGGWVDAVGLLPMYPYATSDPATSYHRRRGQDTYTRSASIFRLGSCRESNTKVRSLNHGPGIDSESDECITKLKPQS